MRSLETWRLRAYIVAFIVALVPYGLVHGTPASPIASLAIGCGIALLVLGTLTGRAFGTWIAVWLILIPTLISPLGLRLAASSEPLADTLQRLFVWPSFILCLIGSRVLVASNEIAFADIWRKPYADGGPVAEQSVGGALALGIAATLAFYAVVPELLPATSGKSTGLIVSALRGTTFVHGAIILTFLVIVAMIVDAVRLHARDRAALNRFRAAIRASGAAASQRMTEEFRETGHTRAARLIAAALRPQTDTGAPTAYEGFHAASRRFLRSLLPFLPLLGFLGTVIGLATAIADLPHGLSPEPGQMLDISGSLAGLAVKFETTLLGLLASLIASLALNLLEKYENELTAACHRVVEAIRYLEASNLDEGETDAAA
jgi:biopolymer transport protein ExbB/TolQ